MKPYKRRQFLIRPHLQLKYGILLASVSLLSALIVGNLVYVSLRKTYFQFLNSTYEMTPQLLQFIEKELESTVLYLVICLGALVALLVATGILMTHKIVGPIFKLSKAMDSLEEGQKGVRIVFRKGDEFPELAEKFNKIAEKYDNLK